MMSPLFLTIRRNPIVVRRVALLLASSVCPQAFLQVFACQCRLLNVPEMNQNAAALGAAPMVGSVRLDSNAAVGSRRWWPLA